MARARLPRRWRRARRLPRRGYGTPTGSRQGWEPGASMKTRAAVLRGVGQDFEVDRDRPGRAEGRRGPRALRRVRPVPFRRAPAAHRQVLGRHGPLPDGGWSRGGRHHRGGRAGRQLAVVGDHVVCSFLPACGHCRWCSIGRHKSRPSEGGAPDLMSGAQVDGRLPVTPGRSGGMAACACSARSTTHGVVSLILGGQGGGPPTAGDRRARGLRGPHRLGQRRLQRRGVWGRGNGRHLRDRWGRHQRSAGRLDTPAHAMWAAVDPLAFKREKAAEKSSA